MKFWLLRFLVICALIIPALPYFMWTKESFVDCIWINYLWFKTSSVLFLVFVIVLIILSIKYSVFDRGEKYPRSVKLVIKGLRYLALLSMLSLISYVQIDNLIQFWQIRKIDMIFEINNLYEKKYNELPEKLKRHNRDSRWFLENYSSIGLQDGQIYGGVFYKRDLLIESYDCSLYYSKGRLNSGPFKKIRKGKKGYDWYKYCMY